MTARKVKSIVRIVGAGPGDVELITIKGAMALQQADVLLYDALVNEQLIHRYVPDHCKLVYVGKRRGKKEFSQDEINDLIVFYASRYSNVVRLKGGDPFIYGRGHEELMYASRRGIQVEVIPGVSSAIAAPSAAGIPLTKRGINESFWVVTGTLASGDISTDIYHASRSSATVVILMGMTKLERLVSIFTESRGVDEPIAIVRYATWEHQQIISGTMQTIHDVVRESGIEAPAVIVVGKVVNESLLFQKVSEIKSQYIQA